MKHESKIGAIVEVQRKCRNHTGVPKSRTGCFTCRKRRVKCDETKPQCLRCAKFGFVCDGFPTLEPKHCKPVTQSIRPKPEASHPFTTVLEPANGSAILPRPPASQSLSPPPSTVMFESEQEWHHFQRFCANTVRQISGFVDSPLWNRLILQACESHRAIRHGVIAIAALDLTSAVVHSRKASLNRLTKPQFKEAERSHHFALQQYGKALREVKDAISNGKQDLRTALLSCVLFYCFETFHGDHQSAIAQIHSGLSLLDNWTKSDLSPDTCIGGTVSPRPDAVEDELIQTFNRLDIHAMSFFDNRPKADHSRMKNSGSASLLSMPRKFENIKEARLYLELIVQRAMHFIASTSQETTYDGCLRTSHHLSKMAQAQVPEQQMHVLEYLRWNTAFEPLLRNLQGPSKEKQLMIAYVMKIHYLTGCFAISSLPSNNKHDPNRFMPSFKEIVSLSKFVLQNYVCDSPGFVFDLRCVAPLYVVGSECLHRATRREAIRMLLSAPRREGLWDAMLVGRLLTWVCDVEEEGLGDEEFVPAEKRLSGMEFDFSLEARTLRARYLQPVGSDLVPRSVDISW